jgi:hypothetical protein
MAARKWRWALGGAVVLVALVAYLTTAAPGARSLRQFDPERMADLDLRMWQAYYAKERVRLFTLLVTTLREQYRYSWTTATVEGFYLARAAATFGDATSDYDRVLPDLEQGYRTAKEWLDAGFDPGEVAKAELGWWVARRTSGQNSPAQVGARMADAYALLYEAPRSKLVAAATLRAEAAAIRDAQASSPDWPAIRTLLEQSYQELHAALSNAN